MNIWVDADACPKVIKELLFKTSLRLNIPLCLVANSYMNIPFHELITFIKVESGDLLIGKSLETNKRDKEGNRLYKDTSIYVRKGEYGYVDDIYYNVNDDGLKYCKVRLRKVKKPEMGDKFASRVAQKGTIGMILPYEDMPVTKEGIVPDIIVNPHAFPSRMTLGQFMETILGKFCCTKGYIGDSTSFTNIQYQDLTDLLELSGYDKYGNEVMYNGRTGQQLRCNIFIGPT